MKVGYLYDDAFLRHDTGPGHPERADRLRAVEQGLAERGLIGRLERIELEAAGPDVLGQVHDAAYVEMVAEAYGRGVRALDADTPISQHSYEAGRLAAGAAVAACHAVLDRRVSRAFCAVRPPGHHAERDRAMGFCLFNNIAVAAEHLIRVRGLKRVAIVDFDVHHGNGTQHAFENRADVLFISIHQDPLTLFPGTGQASEIGRGAGKGFTLNVPMPPGSGGEAYQAAFTDKILPRLEHYRPEFLLISAGFDAAAEDPLAQIDLSETDFAWMTARLAGVADRFCDGRLVSTLEGGYNLSALARCTAAHVESLLTSASHP